MSYNPQEIFQRLGVYVNWCCQLDETKAALDARLEESVAGFNIRNVSGSSDKPSDADMKTYEALIAEVRRQQEVVDSLHDRVVGAVSGFLQRNVSGLLGLPERPPADVLDALIAFMRGSSDTVLQGGRFDAFVEENFQKELPAAGTATIDDTWAGPPQG